MFYLLYEWWPNEAFTNVFRYVTFRAAMGAITAFLFSIIAGKFIITFLRSKNIKEQAEKKDSAQLAEMHASKSSTPTMGGIIILLTFALSTILWGKLDNSMVWIVLLGTLALGGLGAVDDWMKLTILKSPGMSAKMKMGVLLLIGLFIFFTYAFLQPELKVSSDTKIIKLNYDFLYSGLLGNEATILQLPFKKE